MMRSGFLAILLLGSVCSAQLSTAQDHFWYQLHRGDSLGSVLHAMGIGPLWGPRGHVAQAVKLNQDLFTSAEELPDPGTWIRLPNPADPNWTLPAAFAKRVRWPMQTAVASPSPQNQPAKKSVDLSKTSKDFFLYQLQRGDSLGSVLHALGIGPLWGSTGHVAQAVKLNQDLFTSAEELPDPGTWIRLPDPADPNWTLPAAFAKRVRWKKQVAANTPLKQSPESPAQIQAPQKPYTGPGDLEKAEPNPLEPLQGLSSPTTDAPPTAAPPPATVSRTSPTTSETIEPSKASKDFFLYQLKRGDSLGSVLHALGIGPLWGSTGHVAQAVKLNEGLFSSADALPDPGAWIQLPYPPDPAWRPPDQYLSSIKNIRKLPAKPTVKAEVKSPPEDLLQKIAELERELEDLKSQNQELQAKAYTREVAAVKKEVKKGKIDPKTLLSALNEACAGDDLEQIQAVCEQLTAKKEMARIPSAVSLLKDQSFYNDWGAFNGKLGLFMTGLRASGANAASLSTSLHTGVEGNWLKTFQTSWQAIATASLHNIVLNSPDGRTVSDPTQTMYSLLGGVRYLWTDHLFTDFKVGLSQSKLLKEVDDNQITLVNGTSPVGQVSLRYEGFFFGPFSLSLEAGGRMLGSGSSGGVNLDSGYGAYVVAEQRVAVDDHHMMGADILADYSSTQTSTSTNVQISFGGRVFWLWKP